MKTTTKTFIGLGMFIILLFLFSVWYKITYSMEKIGTYEIKKEYAQQKILIATQGSEYKDAIVEGIIDSLKINPVNFKVIDVSNLTNENIDEYDAIIILHTWEMSKPPVVVAHFLKERYNPNKIFVIATSGAGDEKIANVDAITGASLMEEVPEHLNKIKKWLDNNILLESKR